MPNWKKVLVSGSSAQLNHITASGNISSSNINAGTPTSNAWGTELEGSYFNNFDSTTDVSEILRFIAGAMSHSLDVSDAAPNTQYWSTLSTYHTQGSTTSKSSLLDGVLVSDSFAAARLSNSWTGSAFIDSDETGSYRAVLDYLELKGWVLSGDRGTGGNDVGTNPFHGSYGTNIPSTIQTNATFDTSTHTLTGNEGGTTATGNQDYWGLGPLNGGLAQPFYVNVIASQSFSDNYGDYTTDGVDETSTFTRNTAVIYTQAGFGTSNGITLAKIETAQPAVIPAAYQDGRFVNTAGALSGRQYTGGSTDENDISASGYYATHGIKAGIKSGSQSDYVFKNGSDSSTKFYLYTGGLPTDITDGEPTAVVSKTLTRTGFSATSRSLSGAPYLLTTTYNFTFNSEVSKSFDPCYGYSTSPLVNAKSTDGWNSIGTTALTNTTTTVTNNGVQSTGGNNYVIDSTKTTNRGSGDIPEIQDIAVVSSSFEFELQNNTENVTQNRSTDEVKNYDQVFRARGRNWKSSYVSSTSATQELYDATLFGQHSDSGSMAVYSRIQGYDSNTLQDLTETFTGEDYRIVLADNVQTFTGQYFTTDNFQTNDEGDAVIGQYDLQVKPGYLVNPTGSFGYWFTGDSLPASSTDYRFYIRKFQTDGTSYANMTINLDNKTLQAWNSTSDGISCALLFESSGNGSGNNSSLSVARIYDPVKTTSTLIEADIAQDNFKNPFTTAIHLYGNSGGSILSNTYTVPISNAVGIYLDSSDNEFYVIVRYKGDPTPINDITLTFS